MKILAIYGSPNKKGNSASIVDAILKGADRKGHEIDKIYLFDMEYSDCTDCEDATRYHRERYCIKEDDFTNNMISRIIESDLLIVSSPIYMGQITGNLKTFFDRWHTFIEKDFKIRLVKGKKFITVLTSGAPVSYFQKVSEYLSHWLSDFFKMEKVADIYEGELMGRNAINDKPEVLKKAEEIGEALKD